ncbi:MAG: ABC transporter permease [Tannerellaceae bacterium]|jgi:putative ABC transport system permease protein|nr:ABC transporter permease [Tannerellaceae bacterium]
MIKHYFMQALATLRENPLVSFFTILGTALAVAMMMALALVCQVKTAAFPPVSERGRMLYVYMIEGMNEQRAGYRGDGISTRLVNECFYAMETPEAVTAVSASPARRQVSAAGSRRVRECDVRETDAAFWRVFDFRFLHGRPYTDGEFASAVQVAVVSERVAREFFGTTDVTGLTIRADYADYRIVGVAAPVSEVVGEAYGELWIPWSLNADIMGGDFTEGIGGQLQVTILARKGDNLEPIREEARRRLAAFNAGQKEFKANIWKQPVGSLRRMFYREQDGRMQGVFSGMLSLAALFLFLPVFNLSGILYSQIQKRRPEFGLRKAFGATTGNVMGQIVAENFIVTFAGGLIGLCLSVLFFYVAKDSLLQRTDVSLQLSMVVKPSLFAAALLACLAINLLSAGLPAWRTSRANAAESLSNNL